MKKIFCDNCGREEQKPRYSLLQNVPYGKEELSLQVTVKFSFLWTDANGDPAPDLCLPCQIKLLRDVAIMVERGWK